MTTILVSFAVGVIVGVFGFIAWWARRLSKPEIVQKILRGFYAKAHGHWLQLSKDDATPVCPVCGWSEPRGNAARIELAAEVAAQKNRPS